MAVEGISVTPVAVPKIRDMLGGLPPGAPFKVTVLRGGEVLELTGKAP
jgi:hypothetical protein